jgi:PAS domain S-box-containing protein
VGTCYGALLVCVSNALASDPATVALLREVARDVALGVRRVATEEALVERERSIRSLYEHMLNGVAMCRMIYDGDRPVDFVYLDVNAGFTALTGLRDVVGKRASVVTPGIRELDRELLEIYARVARGGPRVRVERYVRAMDQWLDVSVYQTGHECFATVFDVVTDRKRTETALRDSESQLRTMFELAPVGMGQADPRTMRFVRVNQRMAAITGYRADELLGMTIGELTHPDDRAADAEAFGAVIRGDRPAYKLEKRYLRKDGTVAWVCVNMAAIRDASGAPIRTVATIEDIGERRAAEAARRLLTIALHAADNAIVITDATGVVRWANAAFSRLTGYSADEIVGAAISVLKSDVQPPEFFAQMWSTIASGETWHGELVNRRKDGSLFCEDMTITPVRDARGAITDYIAIKQDVTERRYAERALVEAEERSRLALDAAEQGTFVHDFETGLVHVDDRARRHFCIDEASLDIAGATAVCHPDDREVVQAAMAAVADPQGPPRVHVEHRVFDRDGSVRWVSVHLRIEADPSGRRRRAIATTRDVTAEKHAEEEMRASEERYRSLVDSLEDVIFSTDSDGRITFMNHAFRRFGYDPKRVVGRSRDEFVHPDDVAMVRAARGNSDPAIAQGPLEYRLLDASGRARTVRSTSRQLVVGGRHVGATGVLADLTTQRETEERLRAAQKMEAIGRLAGGIAHDFNNLLGVILSYTELSLADLRPEDPLRADLQEIGEAASRAAALTRQLLAFSRRQVLEPEVLDVGQLVNKLANMLRRMIGEDIELAVSAATDLFLTKADRGQIEQVVMNLVVNARDAMPVGGRLSIDSTNVSLEGRRASALDVAPGAYVELRVTDTGHGMDEATRARAFEPFFTTKGVGKGTGLGLSTVYGIVRQSNGAIDVETTPSQGASFRVYLPRHVEEALPPRPPEAPRSAPRGHETILVVEDEPALRNVVRRSLAAAGYRVLVASNGGEALLSCEKHGGEIALVVTDVVMPGLSGRELAERLARLCPTAKILFMSGHSDEAIEQHGVLGPRFLRKPFDRETLAERVRAVLDGS